MATPTDSAAPDAPTNSSIFAGVKTLVQWFSEVPTWIRGLSPSGASAYDTGWVDLAPGTGFSIGAGGWIKYRRIGKNVYLSIRDAIPSSSAAATLTTIPAAPAFELTLQFVNQSGQAITHGTWVGASGQVRAIWSGGTNYRISTSYPAGT